MSVKNLFLAIAINSILAQVMTASPVLTCLKTVSGISPTFEDSSFINKKQESKLTKTFQKIKNLTVLRFEKNRALNKETYLEEEQAIRMLKKFILETRKNRLSEDQAKLAIQNWLHKIKLRQDTKPLNVIEHVSLVFLLRNSHFLQKIEDSSNETLRDMKFLVEKSWVSMTGKVPRNIFDRLPQSVLRKSNRKAQTYHSAVHRQLRKPVGEKHLTVLKDTFNDYVVGWKTVVSLGVLSAIAFDSTGGSILAGALLGAVAVSMTEYAVHRWIGHASQTIRQNILMSPRLGWFGREFLWGLHFNHGVIHHQKTFNKDYTRQWNSAEHKKVVDAAIDKTAKRKGMPSLADLKSAASRYGVTMDKVRATYFMMTLIPAQILLTLITGIDTPAIAAMLATGYVFPFASKDYHPYMHLRRPKKSKAWKRASTAMKFYLGTQLAELMSQVHFMHHKFDDTKDEGNFALGLPLADWLFNTIRKPHIEDLLEMHDKEILGGFWEFGDP